jgi:hypothetical protein
MHAFDDINEYNLGIIVYFDNQRFMVIGEFGT